MRSLDQVFWKKRNILKKKRDGQLGKGLCHMPLSFQWEAWLYLPSVCPSLLGGLGNISRCCIKNVIFLQV